MEKLNISVTVPSKEDLLEAVRYIISWSKERKVYVFGGLGVVAFTFAVKLYGRDLRQRYFAVLLSWLEQTKDEKYESCKKALFEPLASLKSNFPEMRAKNGLRILEVGVGTGANFEFYPDNTHLIVVDPNPHFQKYYGENCKKFPNIEAEDIIVGRGEDMAVVAGNSVDVVVTTLVLCSVADEEKFTKEVYRVLAPGGKFFFMEHVKEWDWKRYPIRWFLQILLTYSYLWPTLFDGCLLTRNPLKNIQAAGFSSVSHNFMYAPMPVTSIFYFIAPHLQGIATK